MTHIIIGRTTQTTFKDTRYQPGADVCACGYCSIGTESRDCERPNGIRDYELADDSDATCCGGLCRKQPVCARVDGRICDIGPSRNNESPLLSAGWDTKAPKVQCVFDLDKINTKEQVRRYNAKFGINRDVEAKYCFEKVTNCPNNNPACSRLFSLDDGAIGCNLWFSTLPGETKDAYMNQYCRTHKTNECKCVDRFKDETYKAMKGYKSINDGCWYLPCGDTEDQFIPQNLQNPTCPDKVCQQIFEFIKDQNININDVKENINCDFSSQSGQPGPTPPTPPGPTPPLKPGLAALAVGVGVLLLILFMVFK